MAVCENWISSLLLNNIYNGVASGIFTSGLPFKKN
jgi:hypothetical protein